MIHDSIFTRILKREIPATFVHEDEHCFVIRDIAPKAPFHVLVIAKLPIVSLETVTLDQQALLGHLLWVAKRVADAAGTGHAFRVISNSGPAAGQSVPHLHFHVLGGHEAGGRPMTPDFA